jgi:hypothetical protein
MVRIAPCASSNFQVSALRDRRREAGDACMARRARQRMPANDKVSRTHTDFILIYERRRALLGSTRAIFEKKNSELSKWRGARGTWIGPTRATGSQKSNRHLFESR